MNEHSMNFNELVRNVCPRIAYGVALCLNCPVQTIRGKALNITARHAVHKALDQIISVLFPGCHGELPASSGDVVAQLERTLLDAALSLKEQCARAFGHECPRASCAQCAECGQRAETAVATLLEALPEIQRTLHLDIAAAYEGDPAAKSAMEVVLSYPGVYAVIVYRIAHVLYCHNVPLVPRIMSEYAHSSTGIDIHPGAEIGPSFFIDHGTGVVIGETTVIGRNVKIYQGVTLGALSFEKDERGMPVKGIKRHPNVGDNVIIYAGATILGGDTTIGSNSIIGGNVWLTHSVPPNSIVYNQQPRPLVKRAESDRHHGSTPDK